MTERAGVIVASNVLLYLWLRLLTALGALEYRTAHCAGLRAAGCMWRGRVYLLDIEHDPS